MKTGDDLRLAPNSTLWNTPITNYSREPLRKFDVTFGVDATQDLELVLNTLLDVAKFEPRVEKQPEPQVFVNSLGGTITITLQYWAKTAQWATTSRDMLRRTKKTFDEKGIAIV